MPCLTVPGEQGNGVTVVQQIECRIHSRHGAAHNGNVLSQLLFMPEHIHRCPDLHALRHGHRSSFGTGAACGNHCVKAFHHLRGCVSAKPYLHSGLIQLADEIFLEIMEGPLAGQIVCMLQLTAQGIGLLKQRHLMSSGCRSQCCLHASRSAADDRNLLYRSGLREHMIPDLLQSDLGIHRAVSLMAVVAVDAGTHILASALQQLHAVFLVADKGTCHGNQIRLSLGNKLLDQVKILESAHRCTQSLDACCLKCRRIFQIRGILLGGSIVAGMGHIAGPGTNLENIHQPLAELAIADKVLLGIAAIGEFSAGNLNLNGEILSADTLNCLKQLQGQPRAVLKAAAVLILPLIEYRRQGLCQNRCVIAHVNIDHIKADGLELLTSAGKALDKPMDFLPGHAGQRLSVPSENTFRSAPQHRLWNHGHVIDLRNSLIRRNIDHGGRRRHGAMGMNPVDHPPEAALNMAVLHIKIAGKHLVGITVPEHTRRAGNDGSTVLCQRCCKVDGLLRGPGLGSLNALGNTLGVNQPVFQHQISHLHRGENVRIAVIHIEVPSFLRFAF